ncbi:MULTISPECIES: hypothetical protein [Photorhabdus]|uniref:Uncharacterized protein n=2 Tax=Photorhabdus TaxID=29487 RepID=A0A7X5QQL6_9GAMM|nr:MULTISPECIES: hypothetical protein [Photorhabdus]MQL50119.1 hypothetical protein [Photorhabdus khanii]NHB98751.1 hypothetical protein [Photorhabdus stackebrandtii]
MFKNLLKAGTLALTLLGGIGTALAVGTEYYCPAGSFSIKDQKVYPDSPLVMWVVHSENKFSDNFLRGGRKWSFRGPVYGCYLDSDYSQTGKIYYAAEYIGEWLKK